MSDIYSRQHNETQSPRGSSDSLRSLFTGDSDKFANKTIDELKAILPKTKEGYEKKLANVSNYPGGSDLKKQVEKKFDLANRFAAAESYNGAEGSQEIVPSQVSWYCTSEKQTLINTIKNSERAIEMIDQFVGEHLAKQMVQDVLPLVEGSAMQTIAGNTFFSRFFGTSRSARLDWNKVGVDDQLQNVDKHFKNLEKEFNKRFKDGSSVVLVSKSLAFAREFRKLVVIRQTLEKWQQTITDAIGDLSKNPALVAVLKMAVEDAFHSKADAMDHLVKKMDSATQEGEEKKWNIEKKLYQYSNIYVIFEPYLDENNRYEIRVRPLSHNETIRQLEKREQHAQSPYHDYIAGFDPQDCFKRAKAFSSSLNTLIKDIECNIDHYVALLKESLQDWQQSRRQEVSSDGPSQQAGENQQPFFFFSTIDEAPTDSSSPDAIIRANSPSAALEMFCQKYNLIKDDERLANDEEIVQALRKECERVARGHDAAFKKLEQAVQNPNSVSFCLDYAKLPAHENALRKIIDGKNVEEVIALGRDINKYRNDIFHMFNKYDKVNNCIKYDNIAYGLYVDEIYDIVHNDHHFSQERFPSEIQYFIQKDLIYDMQLALKDKSGIDRYKDVCTLYQNVAKRLTDRDENITEFNKGQELWYSAQTDVMLSFERVLKNMKKAIDIDEAVLPKFPKGQRLTQRRQEIFEELKTHYEGLTQIQNQLKTLADEWPKQVQLLTTKTEESRTLQLQIYKRDTLALDRQPNPVEKFCQSYRDLVGATTLFTAFAKRAKNDIKGIIQKEIQKDAEVYMQGTSRYPKAINKYPVLKNEINNTVQTYREERSVTINKANQTGKEFRNKLFVLGNWLKRSVKDETDAQTACRQWQASLMIVETLLSEDPEIYPKRALCETSLQQVEEGYKQFLDLHPEIVFNYHSENNAEEIHKKVNLLVELAEQTEILLNSWFSDKDIYDHFSHQDALNLQAANMHLNEYWQKYEAVVDALPEIENYVRNHPLFFFLSKEKRDEFGENQNQMVKDQLKAEKDELAKEFENLKKDENVIKYALSLEETGASKNTEDADIWLKVIEVYKFAKDTTTSSAIDSSTSATDGSTSATDNDTSALTNKKFTKDDFDALVKNQKAMKEFCKKVHEQVQKIHSTRPQDEASLPETNPHPAASDLRKELPIYALLKEIDILFQEKELTQQVLELTGMTKEQFPKEDFLEANEAGKAKIDRIKEAVKKTAEQQGWAEVMKKAKNVIYQINNANCAYLLEAIGEAGDNKDLADDLAKNLAKDLVDLFADQEIDDKTRLAAGTAVGKLGDESAARRLVDLLPREDDQDIHDRIQQSLDMLKCKDKAATPEKVAITQIVIDKMIGISKNDKMSPIARQTANHLLRIWNVQLPKS